MDQKREPGDKPTHHSQSIFDKGGMIILQEKDSLFSKWYWVSWTAACKPMKLEHAPSSYTKVNSEWFKDLTTKLI